MSETLEDRLKEYYIANERVLFQKSFGVVDETTYERFVEARKALKSEIDYSRQPSPYSSKR